jgi:hypothetical protein
MKTKLLFALLFITSVSAYNILAQTENTISIQVVIPVIIEKIEKTDYTKPEMTDLYSLDKTTWGLSIKIPQSKIEVLGNLFKGSYTNEYFPYEKIDFKGKVSKDRMKLLSLDIKSSYSIEGFSAKSEVSDFTVYNLPISHSSLPLADDICKFDKDISSVKVNNYKYTKTSSGRHSSYSLTRTYKRVNTELLPGLEDIFRFKIKLNMDGPPSYTIHVEDLPKDDPDYSHFLSERQGEVIQVEPNSVAIYKNDEDLDEASIFELKRTVSDLLTEFTGTVQIHKGGKKVYIAPIIEGVKVFERTKMDKILQEIELGESGLATEESKVRSGRLMIEEVALLVRTDFLNNYIEYKILSKEKATKITALNLNENNFGFAKWEAKSESVKLVSDYLKQD